jgi:hypothetical protein
MADMNNNGGIMRVKRKTKTYESGASSGTTSINNGGAGLLSGPVSAHGRDKRQSLMEAGS